MGFARLSAPISRPSFLHGIWPAGRPDMFYISTMQEEPVRAGVLPIDCNFEGHRQLVGRQPGDVPVTYADRTSLERRLRLHTADWDPRWP